LPAFDGNSPRVNSLVKTKDVEYKWYAMQTLYLKYRPQKISELDLRDVRETLAKMLSSDKMPHAWLLTGPRGTGKTSSARILAKTINCEKRKGAELCNVCEMCISITQGSAVDVIEIDAASNRGIDEIRELRDKVRLAPMRAKYKVYIIDEVHMLTTEAANALLKTLEEPPAHTLFILCTTEPEKLPETVVSRCTRILFKRPTVQEAVESLKRVAEGEKVKTEPEALKLIAKAAKGSFRDGTKLLEQAMITGEITEAGIRQVLGMLEAAEPDKFVELVSQGKSAEALEFVNGLTEQGINLRGWVERTTDYLREKLLADFAKSGRSTAVDGDLKLIAALEEAYERMKGAVVPQLPLEVMVIELAGAVKTEGTKTEAVKKPAPVEKKEAVNEPGPNAGKFNLTDIVEKWGEILKAVRRRNHSVEALLRSTKPAEFDGDKLVLEVFYKFHKDKLETDKCRQLVEEAVAEVFNLGTAKVYLRLGQKQANSEEVTAKGVDEDIVKAAEAIFGAEVV
jgi:DNA polymerase III subunit gamma/tau